MRWLKRQVSTIQSHSSAYYCSELVKKNDYNQYLCSLFCPTKDRTTLWAIRAFNVEISQIRDHVKDVNIGKMRMEWWRNVIDQTFQGKPPLHPVAQAIAEALKTRQLTQSFFKRVITERVLFL